MLHFKPGMGGLIVGALIFAISWAICFRVTPRGGFNFEPRGPGSFEQRLANYMQLVEIIIGLSTGSIVLLAGSAVFRSGGRLPWFYASPLVLLALSVVLAVLFLSLLVRSYESFLHDQHSYTRVRYSVNVALGFAGLLCFAVGYLWLGFAIANQ